MCKNKIYLANRMTFNNNLTHHLNLFFDHHKILQNANLDFLQQLVKINVYFAFYNNKFKVLLIIPEFMFSLSRIPNFHLALKFQDFPILLNQVFQFLH